MKRRSVLLAAGLGLGGTTVAVTDVGSPVRSAVAGLTKPEWLDSIEWNDAGHLVVTFESEHGLAGVGFVHEEGDPVTDRIHSRSAPAYSGSIEVDLVTEIKDYYKRFPSRTFKVVGYEGAVNDYGQARVRGTRGSYSFDVPAELVDDSYFA